MSRFSKYTLVSLLMVVSFVGCSPSGCTHDSLEGDKPAKVSLSPRQPYELIAKDVGGISGGGGSTAVPQSVTRQDIAGVTAGQLMVVLSWANFIQFDYLTHYERDHNLPHDTDILFKQRMTIQDLAKDLAIELHMNDACLDRAGNPVDGSVIASTPNGICISPYRLAPRLSKNNYRAEIAALIVHELIHMLGGDEATAQRFQSEAIYFFFRESDFNYYQRLYTMDERSNLMWGYVGDVINSLSGVSQLERAVGNIGAMYDALVFDDFVRAEFSPLSPVERDRFQQFAQVLSAARHFVRTIDPDQSFEERKAAKQYYEGKFGSQSSVFAKWYLVSPYTPDPASDQRDLARLKINHLNSLDELKTEIERIYDLLRVARDRTQQMQGYRFRTVEF